MLWNRRIETILLMVAGAALAYGSFARWTSGVGNREPPEGLGILAAVGIASGAVMMCVGAVLDYLHQRLRSM